MNNYLKLKSHKKVNYGKLCQIIKIVYYQVHLVHSKLAWNA